MNVMQIRTESLERTRRAGITVPDHLPLLEQRTMLRTRDEALQRLLVLHALAAIAYGFDRARAAAWLEREQLTRVLSERESSLVQGACGESDLFRLQIEGMWALAWALSFVTQLDYWKDCDTQFVKMLPNLRINESGSNWRERASLRPTGESMRALDLGYCLHWSVRQAQLDSRPPPAGLKSYVVEERRRALEWLLGGEGWEDISLDT